MELVHGATVSLTIPLACCAEPHRGAKTHVFGHTLAQVQSVRICVVVRMQGSSVPDLVLHRLLPSQPCMQSVDSWHVFSSMFCCILSQVLPSPSCLWPACAVTGVDMSDSHSDVCAWGVPHALQASSPRACRIGALHGVRCAVHSLPVESFSRLNPFVGVHVCGHLAAIVQTPQSSALRPGSFTRLIVEHSPVLLCRTTR